MNPFDRAMKMIEVISDERNALFRQGFKFSEELRKHAFEAGDMELVHLIKQNDDEIDRISAKAKLDFKEVLEK